VEPAAQGGRIRNSIRIFEIRHCAFPRTLVQKLSSQRLTAGDQTVMGVGWGENGKESESCIAPRAQTATNRNPVVTLVMSLFPPSAMPDDRIAQTLRTEANDRLGTSRCPVQVWVAIVPRKWIKRIVLLGGSLAERTPARISAQKRAFLPPAKISTKTDIKDNRPFCASAVGIGRLSHGINSGH
jgi:hypothetical protein